MATDGRTIFTNGIDAVRWGPEESRQAVPPRRDAWWPSARHENRTLAAGRPKVAKLAVPRRARVYGVSDPVASGRGGQWLVYSRRSAAGS